MTYNPSIPNAGDLISDSQSQIKTNFSQMNTVFGNNHVPPTDGTAANRGKHNLCTLIEQPSDQVTAASEGVIYTKDYNGSTNLFWRPESNGTAVLLTNNLTPTAATNGYTFLPGRLVIQWGTQNIPSQTNTVIVFNVPFASPAYNIQLSHSRATGGSPQSVWVVTGTLTNSQMTVYSTTTNTNPVFWMAIGRYQ
jgi:hypothetical protein